MFSSPSCLWPGFFVSMHRRPSYIVYTIYMLYTHYCLRTLFGCLSCIRCLLENTAGVCLGTWFIFHLQFLYRKTCLTFVIWSSHLRHHTVYISWRLVKFTFEQADTRKKCSALFTLNVCQPLGVHRPRLWIPLSVPGADWWSQKQRAANSKIPPGSFCS